MNPNIKLFFKIFICLFLIETFFAASKVSLSGATTKISAFFEICFSIAEIAFPMVLGSLKAVIITDIAIILRSSWVFKYGATC